MVSEHCDRESLAGPLRPRGKVYAEGHLHPSRQEAKNDARTRGKIPSSNILLPEGSTPSQTSATNY